MVIEYISGKIVDSATGYAIEQAISRLLRIFYKIEDTNKKLLRASFESAKEALELAHVHLKNNEIKEYYEEIEISANYFRDSIPKLDLTEEIQALCFAGICFRLAGKKTKKEFFFDRASNRLDLFIKKRIKQKINTQQIVAAEEKNAQAKSKIMNSNQILLMRVFFITIILTVLAGIFLWDDFYYAYYDFLSPILETAQPYAQAANIVVRLIQFSSFLSSIYIFFWAKTKIGYMKLQEQVMLEEFPGFPGTTIRQLKTALEKGGS